MKRRDNQTNQPNQINNDGITTRKLCELEQFLSVISPRRINIKLHLKAKKSNEARTFAVDCSLSALWSRSSSSSSSSCRKTGRRTRSQAKRVRAPTPSSRPRRRRRTKRKRTRCGRTMTSMCCASKRRKRTRRRRRRSACRRSKRRKSCSTRRWANSSRQSPSVSRS